MAHNVKIKYYARENTQMKPHSFYAQPLPNGTYGFKELCQQASKNTSIEPHTVRAAVEEYVKVVMERLLDGFRVEIGQDFLTLGPGLTAKVKDELNEDGTVKKAVTAADLTATGSRSRVVAVVNAEFSHEFNRSVRWQKTDRHGNVLEPDEEDATETNEENAGEDGNNTGNQGTGGSGSQTGVVTPPDNGGTDTPSDNTGGNGGNTGDGWEEG